MRYLLKQHEYVLRITKVGYLKTMNCERNAICLRGFYFEKHIKAGYFDTH